ncbi:MAG: hypothetical protein ABSF24_03600 [Candidatus Bathyarchaeia archaeon]|jgi:uncharacterized membrane protein YozB (DUF420 family)
MGLFNPNAVFLSDVNLLLQLAILVLLVLGFSFKRRGVYLKHGATMGIAVALHTFTIFAIMVPSLLALTGSFENLLAELVIFSHAVLGSLVELLGLYLVVAWVSHHQEVKVCLGNKKFMKPTMILWLLELALGIIVYILLYVPI